MIPALSYLLSFLGLKLIGNERYAHVGDHAFDPGLGLFAGLNVLPKCTAMSTYSYGLDDVHIRRLQTAFVKKAIKLGLYDGRTINLDFHTVPHYGDESVLETHWAGARGKRMKGALTLIAQDAASKLMLYTDADIRRSEADDGVLDFLSFWKKVRRGVSPKLIFDARFTSYSKLSALNANGIKFITLRRRGERLIEDVDRLEGWRQIHIPHAKRKYPNPQVHVSTTSLRGYAGELRQIIVRGNGHDVELRVVTRQPHQPGVVVPIDVAHGGRQPDHPLGGGPLPRQPNYRPTIFLTFGFPLGATDAVRVPQLAPEACCARGGAKKRLFAFFEAPLAPSRAENLP